MILDKTDKFCLMRLGIGPLQTNCYLLQCIKTGDGVVIDPGWNDPAVTDLARDSGMKVLRIINTHGHADHIAGNGLFDVPVLIHRADGEFLDDPAKNLSAFSGAPISSPSERKLIDDGSTIKIGELELEIIHTPGHTPGGISIKFGDILFSGDTLFHMGIGRTDLPGGDLGTILKSIETRLFSLPGHTKVFPGHGPETTIEDSKKFIEQEFSGAY